MMKIYIPFSKLQDATVVSLRQYPYQAVKVKGKFGYSKFLKDRWEEGSFINVEHDCVIWPGAIEGLENCLGTWCAYDYIDSNWGVQQEQGILHGIPMGCMKITHEVLAKTEGIWDKGVDWHMCDIHLFNAATRAGLKIHQHFPGVTNANSELTKLTKGEIYV